MLKLQAKTRTVVGKKNQALREQDLIPAVVYGRNIKNQNIQLGASVFSKIFNQAGETSIIDLQISDQEPVKVIIQDVSKNAVSGAIIHIDFHQIREDEELTVEVELEFVGESPAVKEFGAVLIKSLDVIKIQCLPANLIHKIEVDISALKEFGNVIYVKDLKITEKVKVLENIDEAVVSVSAPRTDKELEDLEEKPEETELPEGAEEEDSSAEAQEGAKAEEAGEKTKVTDNAKSEEKNEKSNKK